MEYVKTTQSATTIVTPQIEPTQKKYLCDNILQGIEDVRNDTIKKSIVVEAPTGSGKSFTITNYTAFEIAKKFPDIKNIFFLAPSQECVDEPKETMEKFDNMLIDGKLVRVYNESNLKYAFKWNDKLSGDIRYFIVTTQFFYGLYENFNLLDPNVQPVILPDLIINDEAHHGLGVPDASTTKEDKGVKIKNWQSKWFDKQTEMLNRGTVIIHMTATPTQSQQMKTTSGADNYLQLDTMPKNKLTNTFVNFHYQGNADDLNETLVSAQKTFTNLINEVKMQGEEIKDSTWSLTGKIVPKQMPGMIISLGRSNAVNGIQFASAMKGIKDYAKSINAVLFVSTSKEKHFDGNKIKRMSDGIKLANDPDYLDRPLIMVVVDSGKTGINIPRLVLAVICKVPSQQKIHNSHSQFVARTSRLPFIRDHDMAIEYIKSLNVSDGQKKALISYYCVMSTSFVVVPKDTEIMSRVFEFYTSETFTMEEGIDYMMKGVFGEDDPKQLVSGLTVVTKPDVFNKLYRKDHCEVCEDQRCYHDAVAGYNKQYGANHFTVEDFVMNWMKSLHVDHIDGNRYNNDPSNHVTVCPNVHSLKTQLNEDFRNIYEVEA
jgi:hypothetical protein